jgi:hypothetical protein
VFDKKLSELVFADGYAFVIYNYLLDATHLDPRFTKKK